MAYGKIFVLCHGDYRDRYRVGVPKARAFGKGRGMTRYTYNRWFYGLLLALIAVAIVTAFAGCSQKQPKESKVLPNGAMVRYEGGKAVEIAVESRLVRDSQPAGIVLASGEVIPCKPFTIRQAGDGWACDPPANFPLSATRAGDK